MGRLEKSDKSAKVDFERTPQETSTASDEGSDPSSSRCSCITSSTASTHYRDFSTLSSSTREKLSQNDDQMQIMQNMFNKRSERLRKPCQNGFCYCFTSDSDELRFAGNRPETRIRPKHKKQSHTDKIDHIRPENRVIQRNIKCFENKSRRITLPPSAELKIRCDPLDSPRRCSKHSRRHTFVSKYPLPEPLTSDIDEPLVRIIQEIHRNFVVSKISVNRSKISKKRNESHSPTAPNVTTLIEEPDKTIHIEANNIDMPEGEKKPPPVEPETVFAEHRKDLVSANIPIPPPRSPRKKGGHLLRKRIGDGNSFKQTQIKTPPRKPPRSFSSCSESNVPGKNTNSPGSGKAVKNVESAKTIDVEELYPNKQLSNVEKEIDVQNMGVEHPSPSCPPMSEITFVETPKKIQELPKSQVGWVRPDIANMLNYESRNVLPKQFQSFQGNAQPQTMGWQPPPKLDIDTVDNMPKFKDNGFHNFAVNMECKSTPVKNELIPHNATKLLQNKQNLSPMCTCPVKPVESPTTKKLSPIYESKKDSSFGKKAVDNTKTFFENSRKRIVALVRRKSSRRNSNLKRSVGIQTSQMNLTDSTYTRKALFQSENLDETFIETQIQPQTNGFDRTDAISSVRSQSQEQFDFNRVVNSPTPERSFSNKLIFPRPKILKTLGQRPQEQPQSYRAYDSGVNGDFALAAMNDILGNLRAQLEAAENNAVVQTLDEVAREAKEVDENVAENIHSSTQISAQADIHPEPLYAEIRERHPSVSDQCVQTTEHPPIYVNGDANVIYAEVDKLKKVSKCHTFNNMPEKDSPPKFRNISKSDLSNSSEVFLDNLFNPKKDNLSGEYIRVNLSSEDMMSPAGTSSTAPAETFSNEEESIQYEEPFEEHRPMSEISFGKGSSFSGTGSPKDDSQSHSKLPVCMLHKDSGYYAFSLPERSNSCPPTSQTSALRKYSLGSDGLENINLNHSTSNCKSPNTSLQKYRTLKERLRMSFRRGKRYLKNEKNRFSGSLERRSKGSVLWDQSDLGLSSLYSMDPTDQEAVKRKIEKAVNICRHLPQFESSTELVEAERLLLFSTLKSRSIKRPSPKKPPSNVKDCMLYVETFEIPVKADVNQDTFFNYFYIGVFSNGTNIKSTHSAEKQNNRIVFRDCQVLFNSLEVDFQIKIDIYVLRLRKMTDAVRQKPVKKKSTYRNYNSSDSCDEILSRFRLHGSIIITADCFVPYQVHNECERNLPNNKFCIYATGTDYLFTISEITRSTHLLRELKMEAKAELALKKFELEGFINVQDEKNAHNWNRRWCKLEVFTLCFWNYPQDYSEKPCILKVDLTKCTSFPIDLADGTVCAKQRSFVIRILNKEQINGVSDELFLAAENHAELTHWLSGLNKIGEFLKNWICPVQ